MFEVTYDLEKIDGKRTKFKRLFHMKEVADSEQFFAPGTRLNDGTVIRAVSVKKAKIK